MSFFDISGQASAYYNWFTDESISTTVLLEKKVGEVFTTHGTGFLIYPYKSKKTIVISCEHVLKNQYIYLVLPTTKEFSNAVAKLDSISIKNIKENLKQTNILWSNGDDFIRVEVNLIEGENFEKHSSNLDIAGFKVEIKSQILIQGQNIKLYEAKLIPKSYIEQENNFRLGEDCYFIGFPYGIGTRSASLKLYASDSPKHLVRRATISWISREQNEFLLDALSFGGNSGSPLFKVGWEPNKPSYYLIGIVIGHLNRGKENLGLARVLKSNQILEVVNMLDK